MNTKLKTGDFVMPGDKIAVSEQYLPSKWAYDDGGYIKAEVIGKVHFDNKKHEVSVIPETSHPAALEPGSIIIGEITAVRGQRAMVKIHGMKNNPRKLVAPYSGAIHISQVKEGYLAKLTDAFHIGDMIQAKVTKVLGDSVDLETIDKELGVLKAMCTRCRAYLKTTDNKELMRCPKCDKKEKRKISINYDE